MIVDFKRIKRQNKIFPQFGNLIWDNNVYRGILLKNTINILFPKINKPVGLNIFNQFYPSETQHSVILGELLSPNGKHNMGNMFLDLFFKNVIEDIPFNNNETWFVTVEIERYDIKIRNLDNSTIIILENKSNNARDRANQLYRYWYNGIYKIQNNLNLNINKYAKILYISPKYIKQPDEQTKSPPLELLDKKLFIPKDLIKIVYFHEHIDKWLEKCLNIVEHKSDIYYYLKQYKDFWRYFYVV